MKFIFAIVFLVISSFSWGILGHDVGIIIVGIATILGFLLGKVFELQKDLTSLKKAMAADWKARHTDAKVDIKEKSVEDTRSLATNTTENKNKETSIDKASKKTKTLYHETQPKIIETPDSFIDKILGKGASYVKNYFTGGNLFVRVGIIILFFGVSFLLKYAADRNMFPIEYRLTGVVVGAIILLGLGWRLRRKNETYALLLQGAGIGVLYLDIYAAFSLYQLLPPLAAFALLFIISMFSAALAVMQDSKSLAVLGFSGGFIAPVLASSGSNNHMGLFGYYSVLNLAIVVVAWFKAWRSLNLLGFAFTFIIGTAWGVFSYSSDKFATTEPFLILFFVFYVLIAVLFALRQPPKLRGYVDGSILFGVPLAASGLQFFLVKDFEYGVSLSSFAMGAFYIVISWFVWTRKGKDLKLLAEAFLALGVIFASMAIPFALAPTQTVAAWGLEGAGLLWLGSRQNRLSVRLFGVILQAGAGFIFIANFVAPIITDQFINSQFISGMMLFVAGVLSARLLDKPFEGRKTWELTLSPILLAWGLLWLFGSFFIIMVVENREPWLPTNLIILSAITSLGFTLLAQKLKPEWKHTWIVASGLLGFVLLMAFAQFGWHSSINIYHPMQFNGWLAWPLVFVVYYYLLRQLEQYKALLSFQPLLHGALFLLLVVLIIFEGIFVLKTKLLLSAGWLGIWYSIPAILALWLVMKAKFWPLSQHKEVYQQKVGLVLAAFLMLWSLVALVAKGSVEPLPWIPILNPLDIVLSITIITLLKWWKIMWTSLNLQTEKDEYNPLLNQRVFILSLAGLVFLWLNFTLFRAAHHWFSVPYYADALFNTGFVQTAVSIIWALLGVSLTVYASRKNIRFLWMGGAAVLGLVVLKLFIIDLSALDSLTRIISFLVVGGLLTSIGYFAPLPEEQDTKDV